MQWKRAHLLWASFIMQCLLLGVWEFSYSNSFAAYVYTFIVGFKIAQVRSIKKNIFFARDVDLATLWLPGDSTKASAEASIT